MLGGVSNHLLIPFVYWHLVYNCYSHLSYLSITYWSFFPLIFLLECRKRFSYLKCSIKAIDLVIDKNFDYNVIKTEECDQAIEIFSGNYSNKDINIEDDYSQFNHVPLSEKEIIKMNSMNVIFSFNAVSKSNVFYASKLEDLNFYIGKVNENKFFIIVEDLINKYDDGLNMTYLINGAFKNSKIKYKEKNPTENNNIIENTKTKDETTSKKSKIDKKSIKAKP